MGGGGGGGGFRDGGAAPCGRRGREPGKSDRNRRGDQRVSRFAEDVPHGGVSSIGLESAENRRGFRCRPASIWIAPIECNLFLIRDRSIFGEARGVVSCFATIYAVQIGGMPTGQNSVWIRFLMCCRLVVEIKICIRILTLFIVCGWAGIRRCFYPQPEGKRHAPYHRDQQRHRRLRIGE